MFPRRRRILSLLVLFEASPALLMSLYPPPRVFILDVACPWASPSCKKSAPSFPQDGYFRLLLRPSSTPSPVFEMLLVRSQVLFDLQTGRDPGDSPFLSEIFSLQDVSLDPPPTFSSGVSPISGVRPPPSIFFCLGRPRHANEGRSKPFPSPCLPLA